jgi:hypothetical protein
MSGKSRYDGDFGSGNATDIAAEERSTAATPAATVATDAAVQASWAKYVQNLVSEQIAAISDGVIGGLDEVIDRLLPDGKGHVPERLAALRSIRRAAHQLGFERAIGRARATRPAG